MIEPPYNADNCKAPEKHAKELARVKKVVSRDFTSLEPRSLQSPIPLASLFHFSSAVYI